MINELKPNGYIVVGTNALGLHYGGAARQAYMNFGALIGQSRGCIGGQSYGIVTLDADMQKVSIEAIKKQRRELEIIARSNPDKIFYLTPIGTGIAGFTFDEIEPLFEKLPENIIKVNWKV